MTHNCCYPIGGTCEQCGFPVRGKRYCTKGPMAHKASVPKAREPRPKLNDRIEAYGLGSLVEDALKGVGVTQEKWKDFKGRMGLPRTCNCDARIEYLNALGKELGEAAKSAVQTLLGFGLKRNRDNK